MDLRTVPSAEFTRIAEAGLSPQVVATWDPALVRDPRLLVPVDVRALVVAPGEDVGHADVATTLLGGGEPGGRAGPPPFTDGAARAPGVYLHWALPDALLRGALRDPRGPAMAGRPRPARRRAAAGWGWRRTCTWPARSRTEVTSRCLTSRRACPRTTSSGT
jgi:hypothetical protein